MDPISTSPPLPATHNTNQTGQATTDWSQATDNEIMDADLIVALGLETLSDDDKADFLARMTLTVQKATIARLAETLAPEKWQELQDLAQSGTPEAITNFMENNVPNFAALMEDESVAFKRAMLTGKIAE